MGRKTRTGSSIGRMRQAVAGEVLASLTRLLMRPSAIRAEGIEEVLACKRAGRRIVFVGWHGHDFVNLGVYHPLFGRDARGAILVRDNADGLVLHRFGARMGIKVVTLEGNEPQSPAWARAVVSMIGAVKQGFDAMIAVDGPEGPPYQVKPGAAVIAQRAGAVLVPTAAAASRSVRMTWRWDEQLVPLPFARIGVHFGPVIDTRRPEGEPPTVDELRARIGDALADGAQRAQSVVG